jgi:hypothetical protein
MWVLQRGDLIAAERRELCLLSSGRCPIGNYRDLDIISFVMLSIKIRDFESQYRYMRNVQISILIKSF